jgi:predicted DNA-binding protein with PD1-like motif
MRLSAFLVPIFLLTTLPLQAQITRHPATAEDQRPNDPKVPSSYALSGKFDRILVLRAKNKTDLLGEMEKQVKQQNIKNAVILAGIGSLRGWRVHNVASRDYPVADMFTGNPTQPVDLIGMQGYIVKGATNAGGIVAADKRPPTTISGHLEKGSEVLTFAVITLGILNTDLGRVDDATYR